MKSPTIAVGVIHLGGSGPFQTYFKGALILLVGGFSFLVDGEEEWRASCGVGTRLSVGDGGGVGCSLVPACR
jgi:hypothetical protein